MKKFLAIYAVVATIMALGTAAVNESMRLSHLHMSKDDSAEAHAIANYYKQKAAEADSLSKENEHLRELILAYEQYRQSAEFFLDSDGWDPPYDVFPYEVERYQKSSIQLDKLKDGESLPIPEIVKEVMNQRDQLSDVIRFHHDHALNGEKCDIIRDMRDIADSLVADKTLMGEWAYAY